MKEQEIKKLLKRYRNGRATQADMNLLDSWYVQYNADKPMFGTIADRLYPLADIKQVLDHKHARQPIVKTWSRIAVAASIAGIAASVLYYTVGRNEYVQPATSRDIATVVVPGSSKAVLTLADGRRIDLKYARTGHLAEQAGTRIAKRADGELFYSPENKNVTATAYNKIETPNGGRYNVQLPDGTKVWLNAASSLKYPTAFLSLKERRVELSGEAYFEVSHDEKLPFRIKTSKQLVEVLGTHFNINAYADEEKEKTTVFQGIVSINSRTILYRWQQAMVTGSGNTISVEDVDPEEVVDWKNDDFIFQKGGDFKSAMRKIARWYDVDIVYERSTLPKIEVGGWISRRKKIAIVLKSIEALGKVHFRLEGRRVIVTD